MKILNVTLFLFLSIFLSAQDKLTVMESAYGPGLHRSVPVQANPNKDEYIIISRLVKDEWVYFAKIKPGQNMVIYRSKLGDAKLEEQFIEFNGRFGSVSATRVEEVRIVDVYHGEGYLTFLLSCHTGYIYLNLAKEGKFDSTNMLYLPPRGVNKEAWRVVKITSSPTKLGLKFNDSSHHLLIESIKLKSLFSAEILLKDSSVAIDVDFSRNVIFRDGVELGEGQFMWNPSYVGKDMFENTVMGQSDIEKKHIRDYIDGMEGGRKACIDEIRKAYGKDKQEEIFQKINSAYKE